MTHHHETIGQRLRRLRKQAGLTQIDVSAETGIPRTYLSKIEGSDDKAGTWDAMSKLADLYNVPLDYLRVGDNFSTRYPDTEIIKDRTEIAMIRAFRVLNDDEKRAFALIINSKFARATG